MALRSGQLRSCTRFGRRPSALYQNLLAIRVAEGRTDRKKGTGTEESPQNRLRNKKKWPQRHRATEGQEDPSCNGGVETDSRKRRDGGGSDPGAWLLLAMSGTEGDESTERDSALVPWWPLGDLGFPLCSTWVSSNEV